MEAAFDNIKLAIQFVKDLIAYVMNFFGSGGADSAK